MTWKLTDLESSFLIGSTLVEGSTLTEKESEQILAGKTIQGHPVSEIRELTNYRAAVEWLMEQLSKSPYISTDLLLHFHQRLFQGFPGEHGRWKSHANYTYLSDGNRHDYSRPEKVDREVSAWIEAFNSDQKLKSSSATDSAATQAAQLYYAFEQIHPFEDGNGRIGRILIAYWLHRKWGLAYTFKLKDKVDHLKALEAANHGDLKLLTAFFKKRILKGCSR